MGPKHSNDDLDLLTDEERAGLLADDIVDEGLDTGDDHDDDTAGDDTAAGAEEADEQDRADQAEASQDDAAAVANEATQQPIAEAADATVDNAAVATAADEEERTASWVLPAEVGKKIEDLDKERDALSEQFDDGELTAKEYRDRLKGIEKELDQLKEQRTSANVQRDIAISTYKEVTVPAFFDAHPEYEDRASPLYAMLDSTVRQLQQASRDPLSPRILERAHEQISAQLKKALGISEMPSPKASPSAAGKSATPAAKREIPPTLASVPASDISDVDDGGEFAYLDRLAGQDIEKYEAALAKMPDEARERYLAQ